MLNQISLSGAVGLGITQQIANGIELVKAGEDELGWLFLACFAVFFLNDAGVLFDDFAEGSFGEDAFPQVGGHEAVGVHRIAFAMICPTGWGLPDGFAIPLTLVEG